MAILDFNFNPSDRQLRQFGAISLIALPLAIWLWTTSTVATGWAFAAGVILCGTGLLLPRLLKPVFVGLTIAAMPIGLVVGELAMLLLYFGLFLPMAAALRITGRDSLHRRSPTNKETFWQKRKASAKISNYYHQF